MTGGILYETQGTRHRLEEKPVPRTAAGLLRRSPCGAVPCYHEGDVFEFYRDGSRDDFWHMARTPWSAPKGTQTLWRAAPSCVLLRGLGRIARYIYTGLQGGSIMQGWMKEENTMIACCSDGTRPVVFQIERIDYAD